MTRRFFPLIIALLSLTSLCKGQQQPLKLWYDKPAQVWEETLPLGNGRLGMMPDGGVMKDNIILNDITLWSGSEQDANNYDAYKALPQIRKLLVEGRNDEAQQLINKDFVCKGKGGGGVPFGCYQVLGNLSIQFKYDKADSANVKFENYERELSLNKAVASCTYRVNGVTYTREYFTSFGSDVSIIKLSADKPGQISCSISISRTERGMASVNGNELQLSGQLDNGTDGKGMEYIARVKAKLNGGTISTSNNTLVIKGATEAIIYISAGTDFKEKLFKQKTAAMQIIRRKQQIKDLFLSIKIHPQITVCRFCFFNSEDT
jgi:alpha-L-fucosidase 2